MANETLVVEIKSVVSSATTNSINNVKNQLNGLNVSATSGTENMNALKQAVSSIKSGNVSNLNSSFINLGTTMKQAKLQAQLLKSSLYGGNGIGDGIKEITSAVRDGSISVRDGIGGIFYTIKNSIKATLTSVKATLSTITKVVIPLTIILSLVKSIKNAFNVSKLGDDIDKASQKAGMSVKAYQDWVFVLDRCGVSANTLRSSMTLLQRNLANTVATGKLANSAFGALGVSLEDVNKADAGAIFEKVVTNLQNVGDVTKRTQLATEIFGRNATQLNTVLNMSNEETKNLIRTYQLLGGEMSSDLTTKSATLQDSITNLKTAWQGLKNELAVGLIPVITSVINFITIAIAKVNILIQAIRRIFGKDTAKSSNSAVRATGAISDNLASSVGSAKALKRSLMSFDELNLLQDNSGGGGGSASGASGLEDYGFDEDMGTPFAFLDDDTLKKLEAFKAKADKIADNIIGVIDKFKGKASKLFSDMRTKFSEWQSKYIQPVAERFKGTVQTTIDKVSPKLETFKTRWGECWEATKTLFGEAWSVISGTFNTIVLPLLGGMAEAFVILGGNLFSVAMSIINYLTNLGTGMATVLADNCQMIRQIANGDWSGAWQTFKQTCVDVMAFVLSFLGIDFKKCQEMVQGFFSTIRQIFDNFRAWWDKDIRNGVFKSQTWGELAKNCTKAFLDSFNILAPLEQKLQAIANKIQSWHDNIVSKLSGKYTINIAEHGNNGTISTTYTPVVPKKGGHYTTGHAFATGGVLTEPTYGLMAEYAGAKTNPEIVTPQSLMMDTMDKSNSKMVSAIYQMVGQIITAIEDNQPIVNVGDETIAQSAKRGNDSILHRTGKPLF